MKNKKSNTELMKELDLIKGGIIMDNFNNIIGYNHIKNELNRIIDCINNRDKYERLGVKIPKNLLLHGEPGVGKTAIVEGLAWRIMKGDVPLGLKDMIVVQLFLIMVFVSIGLYFHQHDKHPCRKDCSKTNAPVC